MELTDWARDNEVVLPTVPRECGNSHHLFYLLLPSPASRDALIRHLRQQGILAVFHYQALNASPMGQRFGFRRGDCPVAESASDRLLRLPLFFELGVEERARVVEAVRSFRP